jgi:RNA polymerase sigma-70 factor (ECF subfamily)
MGQFRDGDPGASFPQFEFFREHYGFVPNVFRAQALVPNAVEAEAAIARSVLFKDVALSRVRKERMLLAVAAANRSSYCAALHFQMLLVHGADPEDTDLSPLERALWSLGARLSAGGAAIAEIETLRGLGFTGEGILEAVSVAAFGMLLATLADGFGIEPDFDPPSIEAPELPLNQEVPASPCLAPDDRSLTDFPHFAFLQQTFGSVPEVFRAQMLRPDVLEAEVNALRLLRVTSTEIVSAQGLTEEERMEAVARRALFAFLGAIQESLGLQGDFVWRSESKNKAHPWVPETRPIHEATFADPDAEHVSRVQRGDLGAFEELMNRHGRRVYRTLVGLLGDPEEARDAMQDTFLKAFQHLGSFERRSKFSTWLVSIASNTGLQRLRDRKGFAESLDDPGAETDEGFRPRQVQAWTDDPEKLYSRAETRTLVETSVMKLPAKYRVAVVLRDLEQLSTEEAAAALGLGVPALKARLLRGRLMLRDALSPHFLSRAAGVNP